MNHKDNIRKERDKSADEKFRIRDERKDLENKMRKMRESSKDQIRSNTPIKSKTPY